MRIIVQVCTGPLEGHRYALATGQQMQFGRTAESDVSFPDDDRMSSRHFQLLVDQTACRIRDLASTNGTLVNSESVSLAVLQPGDRIIAGNTEFTLMVEGTVQPVSPKPSAVPHTAISKAAPKLKLSVLEGCFLIQPCKSKLNCYRGFASESLPQALATRLSRTSNPALSIDLSKVGPPFQQAVEPKQPLHDWLPEKLQAETPHVLWTLPEQIGDFSVLVDAWGKDAVVTIYCPPNEPPPLAQIRRCASVYCRPNLARPSLADTTEDQAGNFMQGIDAVLVEDDDLESWVLYSQHDLRETLIAAGLTDSTPTEIAG